MRSLKISNQLRGFLLEIPASFVLVFLYFLFLDYTVNPDIDQSPLAGALFYAFVYFILFLFFYPREYVDILPVITFVKVLYQQNYRYFFYRLGGQLTGALIATYLILLITNTVENSDLSRYVFPLNPFLTGLLTGIFALAIFLMHFFIVGTSENPRHFRYFLFSIGLGAAFYFVSFFEGLTLFNPFGILFMHIFKTGQFGLEIIIYDILIHVITPMAFIFGTFFFLKGFIKPGNTEND